MYRTIMVPLDGFSFANDALYQAAELARRFGARLHIAHVMDLLSVPPYAHDIAARDWWIGRGSERALEYVERQAASVRFDGLNVTTSIRGGPPALKLIDEVSDENVDLIVMNTHARGPVKRVWFGSVADRLLRSGVCPILFRPVRKARAEITRVLVPLDGSDLAEAALPHARAIQHVTGAHATLLHIAHPAPVPVSVLPFGFDTSVITDFMGPEELERSSRSYLSEQAVRSGMSAELTTEGVCVSSEQTAEAILEYAEDAATDLIVMTTHGRSGFARFILGSVADKVLRGSRAPVLIIPAAESL